MTSPAQPGRGICSKCGGAMWDREDRYGAYQNCVTCGTITEDPPGGGLSGPPMRRAKGAQHQVMAVSKDTGCEVSRSCLRCPLSECRLDNQGIAKKLNLVLDGMDIIQRIVRDGLSHSQAVSGSSVSAQQAKRLVHWYRELFPNGWEPPEPGTTRITRRRPRSREMEPGNGAGAGTAPSSS